ncbi:MAG: cyanophycin synthetase, partial [Dehalococcoidia bacterium]
SISLDHMAILGDTLGAIAGEKAGIIKGNAPVVVAPQHADALAQVVKAAKARGAPLIKAGADVTWEAGVHDLSGQALTVHTPNATYALRLPLLGAHQQENAALAVAALEALNVGISQQAVAEGLRSVQWDGRFQVLSQSPYIIVDGAHNAHSMARLCETVKEYLPSKPVTAVFGCSSDKNARPMVEELARLVDTAVVSTSHHPRALAIDVLRQEFALAGVECEAAPDVATALQQATAQAAPDGVVLVTGSLFVVAEALEAWYGLPAERYPEFDPQRTSVHRGTP